MYDDDHDEYEPSLQPSIQNNDDAEQVVHTYFRKKTTDAIPYMDDDDDDPWIQSAYNGNYGKVVHVDVPQMDDQQIQNLYLEQIANQNDNELINNSNWMPYAAAATVVLGAIATAVGVKYGLGGGTRRRRRAGFKQKIRKLHRRTGKKRKSRHVR
jgi:hypothetical protein